MLPFQSLPTTFIPYFLDGIRKQVRRKSKAVFKATRYAQVVKLDWPRNVAKERQSCSSISWNKSRRSSSVWV